MTRLYTAEDILRDIEEGDLEPPGLLPWKRWQTWKADFGRRPAIRRGDAAGTTTSEEALIWRTIMAEFHGPEWEAELRTQVRNTRDAGGGDGATEFFFLRVSLRFP